MQTATPPNYQLLTHSSLVCLLPPLLLTSHLTQVFLGVDKKNKSKSSTHILSSLFCPALMASPLSFHLSRCNSWTCAPQGCWTMCSAFSPTTWSRRLAATTPPVVLRWQPCRRSCVTFWSYVQKTGPVMTPFWFSTVGTRTKALALGHWLVRDPRISALTFL